MNPLDDLLDPTGVPADDGIALMAELVAAVTWLRRGAMPGLTIWDAMAQAACCSTGSELPWAAADPIRSSLVLLLNESEVAAELPLGRALRVWLWATASSFNEGAPWLIGSTLFEPNRSDEARHRKSVSGEDSAPL